VSAGEVGGYWRREDVEFLSLPIYSSRVWLAFAKDSVRLVGRLVGCGAKASFCPHHAHSRVDS
jgi:hypothetical protein